MADAGVRGAPLTDEELGRIATEHVEHPPVNGVLGMVAYCAGCYDNWPCDSARLYALVLRQAALMAAWGLPCSCDPDFDLEPPAL